jgi:hypothetical protein
VNLLEVAQKMDGITLFNKNSLRNQDDVVAYPRMMEYFDVDFNLVQYFTCTNIFSIKEQKRYNGKYTHYTKIFPLETQTEKTNIFYIHS